MENRRLLLDGAHEQLDRTVGETTRTLDEVNCHHNYTELEQHDGTWLWVTRKGAIRAGVGDRGLIPGAMGQRSFVVRGLGNPLSYESCSHGAGRVLSRTAARKTLSVESLESLMTGTSWQASDAKALLDEAPQAYKPIDVVMRDQADLVQIEVELSAIANLKGVERR
jgi:tRNA-splicing ligase RtcB